MAVDITDRFSKAVKALAPGELVKDGHFTLFESVGALEIMDPKMDSGSLANGESLDEEYDVNRDLLPQEVLGIIDQLLCLEMAWHIGYPLSQTLLTSVYVDALMKPQPANLTEVDFTRDPEVQKNQPTLLFVLRAYCIGLLKGCFFVNELVKDELYYEEEDFVTNTYDRNLLCDIPLEPINSLLKKARSDLRAMGNAVTKEISAALDSRLELRIAFLRAMELANIRKANPESLKMPWIQMNGLIQHINKQHSLAKPVPEAFSTKLQRRLASTMPPRPIVQLSFDDTYHHFKRMFQDGKEVMNVLKYHDPHSLLMFVFFFQSSKPQPLVVIRTLLQSLLFKEMVVLGQFSIRQILDHDLSITVLPCAAQTDASFDAIEIPSDPRHQIANQMEIFRQRVAECYLDLFRIFCQNRCRVRRTLCHSIQEWDLLQADVEELDTSLQVTLDEKPHELMGGHTGYQLPLSSWAYLYKLRQMEWIIQLGFELGIYQSDELGGMYWYLNYLGKTRAQHGDRIKTFTLRTLARCRESRPFTSAKEDEFTKSLSYIRITMLDAACTWEFADGLSCLYNSLLRLSLIKPPPCPYSNDAQRYEIRMKPFINIGLPHLPTFDEFKANSAPANFDVDEMLKYATNAVGGARKGYEALSRMPEELTFAVSCHDRWLRNIKDCLKASIAAGVALSTLQKAIAEAGEGGDLKFKVEIPEPGKNYHDWWVVPKLVPVT